MTRGNIQVEARDLFGWHLHVEEREQAGLKKGPFRLKRKSTFRLKRGNLSVNERKS